MKMDSIKPLLKLFIQHFMLKKPPKYTRPQLRVTHSMSLVAVEILQGKSNFAKNLLDHSKAHANLVNTNSDPYLHVGYMMTRIAYQAVGVIDDLPQLLTQAAAPQGSLGASKVKGRQRRPKVNLKFWEVKTKIWSSLKDYKVASSIMDHLKKKYQAY